MAKVLNQESLVLFKHYNTGHNEPLTLQAQISCSNYIFRLKLFVKEYVSVRYSLRHSKAEKPLAFLCGMDGEIIFKWDLKKRNWLSLIGLI
jgi:hypothetical protein